MTRTIDDLTRLEIAVIDNLFADCGDLGCNDYLQTRLDERIAAQIARHEAVMVLISAEK